MKILQKGYDGPEKAAPIGGNCADGASQDAAWHCSGEDSGVPQLRCSNPLDPESGSLMHCEQIVCMKIVRESDRFTKCEKDMKWEHKTKFGANGCKVCEEKQKRPTRRPLRRPLGEFKFLFVRICPQRRDGFLYVSELVVRSCWKKFG